jgi:tRNA/rRNA methyltransferase
VRSRSRLRPEEVSREAMARRPGRTAVVFGEERSGLTAAEIDRCHDLSAIPTGAAQPSLNLAQAVLLYAWEMCRAGRGQASTGLAAAAASERDGSSPRQAGPLATDAQLQALEGALREALRSGGFLAGPERHAVRDLAEVLRRGRPSPREARLWETALRAIGKRPPR